MDLKFKVFLFVVYLLADKLHEAAMFLSAQIIIARATTVLYTLTVVKHKTKFRPYFGLFTKKKKLSFLFCAISKLALKYYNIIFSLTTARARKVVYIHFWYIHFWYIHFWIIHRTDAIFLPLTRAWGGEGYDEAGGLENFIFSSVT